MRIDARERRGGQVVVDRPAGEPAGPAPGRHHSDVVRAGACRCPHAELGRRRDFDAGATDGAEYYARDPAESAASDRHRIAALDRPGMSGQAADGRRSSEVADDLDAATGAARLE